MNLLDMSIRASILIISITALRAIAIHRIPKRLFLLLWCITIIRLLMPFNISSPVSFPKQMSISTAHFLSEGHAITIAGKGMSALFLIYISGMLIVLARYVIAYIKGYRELSTALPVKCQYVLDWVTARNLKRTVQVRVSDRISTPLTYGIIHPIIVIPKNTDWNDEGTLNFILTHEITHIRRFDIVVKFLLVSVVCIHWFNPVVWMLYILANRDIELSCDDAVIRIIGVMQTRAYAHTLIDLSCPNKGRVVLFNNFSKYAIEERIIAITKKRRTTVFSICMVGAVIALSTIAFTSPFTDSQAPANDSGVTHIISGQDGGELGTPGITNYTSN